MLEAIRNLGILKMIEVLDFNTDALDSVTSFLEQREESIEKREYPKLQFESISSKKIGIFSIMLRKIYCRVGLSMAEPK